MNKRILSSFLIIVALLAVTVGSSMAFLWDNELSSGNTFAAGEIKLKIDYHGYYNKGPDGQPNAGEWDFKNLEEGDLFFNFNDIKPGDYGEGTVSLRIDGNDAYCDLRVNTAVNDDNGCEDPEIDDTCGEGEGDLPDNIDFVIWADNGCDGIAGTNDRGEGDNIPQDEPCEPGVCVRWAEPSRRRVCAKYCRGRCCERKWVWGYSCGRHDWSRKEHCCEEMPSQPACQEEVLFRGTGKELDERGAIFLGEIKAATLNNDHIYYLGMGWKVDREVDNIIQSDIYKADIEFYCTQTRHNQPPQIN